MACMTKQVLLDVCKQHKLYRTPSLNDKLYLNFKGFTRIANLEEYTQLRALFLEGNALDSLEGLECLKELRCLYVQQNCITHISGLEQLQHLDTLNISHNQLRKLEGLSCCPNLHTLICTNNQLSSLDSVRHLAQCPGLHTLDLQNNDLQDPAILDVVFTQLTELKCLYLKGNPIVSNIKNYRKAVIGALPELTYLDDRPVFPDERRLVQAWLVGGLEAEREERRRIREEEEERNSRNFELMQAIRREGWRKRREREGLPAGDTDPTLDDLSDSEWVFEEEPPELVEARQRLAAYTARQGEEEPPELTSARQQRAQAGGAIHATASGIGSTSDDGAAATTDGQIYLDSVRQAQEELDQNGRQAVPTAATAVGVSCADTSRADAGGSKQQGSRSSPAKQAVQLAAGAGPEDDVGVLVSDVMPPLELVGDIDDLAALD